MHPKKLTLAGLAALSALAATMTTHAASGTDNYIVAALERIDDCSDPTAEFALLLDVNLMNTGAIAVEMSNAAGLFIELENEGDAEWFGEASFADITAMANATNGLWTVEIIGGPDASTSTFTLNVADMDMQDFYAPPANVLPASGSIAPNAVFTWDDPTVGQNPPDSLFVDTDFQAADLAIGETSWTPPLPLTAGPNSFAIVYSYAADLGTVGPLNVTSGAITWGVAPFAPAGYPANTPLGTFGAETIRCYSVQGVSDANIIEIALERIDDRAFPENNFFAFVDITLEDESVTGVNITTAGGLDYDLIADEEFWDMEVGFGDLDSMLTTLDGLWTVTIEGETPSVSTFVVNASSLVDDDFLGVPTNVFPDHNDTEITPDVVVTWEDPTLGDADVLFVEVNDFDADTVDGTITIDATSWAPPEDLPPGRTHFFVGYGQFADFGVAGSITVDPPGAVAWGLPGYAPPGHPANSPVLILAAETAVQFIVGEPARFEVSLERLDDPAFGGAFGAFIDVDLPGLGATSVQVQAPGLLIPLTNENGDEWEADVAFADLQELHDALDGTWFVTVVGPNSSQSQFHLSATQATDGDFFATPADVFPGFGEIGVPGNVEFSWADPTGEATADILLVESNFDEASTLDGSLDITDESWLPPNELEPGFNEFFVGYLNFADAGFASPIFGQGAIGWFTPDAAPEGYPEASPLVVIGSSTGVQFEVGDGFDCPADVSGDGVVGFADVLAMLAVWGPCEGCPEDTDDDGQVGFSDILLVLGNWGPCE